MPHLILGTVCPLVMLLAAPPGTVEAELPTAVDAADAEAEPGKKKGKKRDKADKAAKAEAAADDGSGPDIEVKGRVQVLGSRRSETLQSLAGTTNQRGFGLVLDSARAGLKAKITDDVSVTIEADFAGRPDIRDGYVQAKGKRYLVRVGRFKMPLSSFTLESPWILPRAERGLFHDVLSDHYLLYGRNQGVMARLEGGGFWDLAATAGVFQTISLGRLKDFTSVLRLSAEPGDTEIALVGQRRVTILDGATRAFYLGGLDLTSVLSVGERYGLRLWGEGHVGQSWFKQPPVGSGGPDLATTSVSFYQVRFLGALRRGGAARGDLYAELFVSEGFLDPDVKVVQDHLLELSSGVNLGHWQRTRLTFEVVHMRSGRNFPRAVFETAALATVARRTAFLMQVGAAF